MCRHSANEAQPQTRPALRARRKFLGRLAFRVEGASLEFILRESTEHDLLAKERQSLQLDSNFKPSPNRRRNIYEK
jgi:hypothetical protein